MKNLSTMLFVIFVLPFFVGRVVAQDMATFRQKAEETVKTKNPQWKLITKEARDKRVTYQWGNEKADVTLRIFYGDSEEEAAEEMKAFINRLSVGPGEKITGYGDEAYMWKLKNYGFAGIRFRKANVFVDLAGTSVALVEDLAKKLADHVKK